MHKSRLRVAPIFLVTSLPCFALAADNNIFTPEKITTGLSLGMLSGEAKERVYYPDEGGRKVSQLNWKYNNAAIVKGNIDWDVIPWATVGVSGWTTLASKGSNMDDYDWTDSSQKNWTDHSNHPNTRLNYANEFDINLKGWLLNTPNYRVGIMAGYKQSAFSWESKGGHYNYDNGTDIGDFDRTNKVIGYSQKFKIPYIGLTGLYRYEKMELSGAFKYSGWVRASDHDEHYNSLTSFKSKGHNQDYYSLSASAGYFVTDNAKIYLEGTWNRMLNKKGNLAINDYGNGEKDHSNGASGIEHTSFMATAGLSYAF